MKRVIVTGGTGYVAGWVIVSLLKKEYLVKASVRDLAKADGVRQAIAPQVTTEQLQHLSFFEADLTSSEHWEEAMSDAFGVIHVASPMGTGKESAEELVRVAKGGTLTILKAATNSQVNHVVMTSSQAASTPRATDTRTLDENFWTDIENPELDAYRISKVAAEKAAWDFMKDQPTTLTTILPGAIFGPVLSKQALSSVQLIVQIMKGMPGIPNVPMEVSDVRDLAELHVLALENPYAYGNRYLAASQKITMPEIAVIIKRHFPELKQVRTNALPNWLVRLAARFVPSLRSLVPMLQRKYRHTTKRAEMELDWTQRTPEATIIDTVRSLQEFNV